METAIGSSYFINIYVGWDIYISIKSLLWQICIICGRILSNSQRTYFNGEDFLDSLVRNNIRLFDRCHFKANLDKFWVYCTLEGRNKKIFMYFIQFLLIMNYSKVSFDIFWKKILINHLADSLNEKLLLWFFSIFHQTCVHLVQLCLRHIRLPLLTELYWLLI